MTNYAQTCGDLIEAMAQAGCPLCRLGDKSVARFLDGFLYDNVNDISLREELRRARGFCNRHNWQLTTVKGSALAAAIVQQDILTNQARALAAAGSRVEPQAALPARLWQSLRQSDARQAAAALAEALGPQTTCPACAHLARQEAIHLHTFLECLRQEPFQEALRSSEGLCVPHLRQALGQAGSSRLLQPLLEAQAAIWERLLVDLSEVIRKNDYRFSHETISDAEAQSIERAIETLTGSRT